MLFVNPSENYHEHVAFLKFENPSSTHGDFEGFPHVISRQLCLGQWDLMLISERMMNFPLLKGFKGYTSQGVKGATYFSKVTSLDWETSMERMRNLLSPPRERTSLYKESTHNPWNEREWTLYHRLKNNLRVEIKPILKECGVRFDQYQKSFLTIKKFTHAYCGFYPQGYEKYFKVHFLFQSEYQRQLRDILGLLPSTCYFFSVGDYLFAEVCFLNKKEQTDLFSFVHRLGEEGYFTNLYQSSLVSTGN